MVRKVPFVTGEVYHVYNRGVDKREIFLDEQDYKRFVYILHEFNTIECNSNTRRYVSKGDKGGVRDPISNTGLVRLVNWCLMPNHYHFCLEQITDNGISKFLQKVMIGYTMYFNKKYNRSGVLFQGKTKSRHVNSDEYFQYLQYYIDFNPLVLKQSGWITEGIKDITSAKRFLEEYSWNKTQDYSLYSNISTDLFYKKYIDFIGDVNL